MCNRNATATWSGFAHQGQVGLLVALRKMKEVDEAEYPNYFLEYEKREDVAIYKNNEHKEYISVHQVKAYYSGGNYKSKYDKVLNEDFEICGNDYLHTVMEITDWDTSETTNNYNIQRYTYGETQFHSDTEDIEGFILNELQEISDDNVQPKALLQRLTYELDLQIRTEHKKGKKKLFDVKFSFEQISQIIAEGILKANEIETYECRRKSVV